MISTNKRWQESIAQAMDETQNTQRNKNRSFIVLPSWLPYATYIAFGFLLAKALIIGHETHPVNYDRDYQTGSSVALLMIAEDVEHYRTTYGELPDDLPSPIASVMDVTYEKITNEHFRLTIPHGNSTITFDAKDDKIYME